MSQAPFHSDDQTHEQIVLKQRQQFQEFMLECTACQEEIEPHWQYCAYCGTRMTTACPSCGQPLPPAGAQSCTNCGLTIPQVNAA